MQGVLGCIVVNKDGVILKTTCEVLSCTKALAKSHSNEDHNCEIHVQPEIAELHSHLIPQLAGLARNMVRDLDPQVRHRYNDIDAAQV